MNTHDCLNIALITLAATSTAFFVETVEGQSPPPPDVVVVDGSAPDTQFAADSGEISSEGAQFTNGHGHGGVFTDLDNDGIAEIYRVRGHRYLETPTDSDNQMWKYDPIAGWSVLLDTYAEGSGAAGIGAIAGDYDNDGDVDLYVVNFNEPNVLYQNDLIETGVFSFTDVTVFTVDPSASPGQLQLGVGLASHNGVIQDATFTASWLDFDRDGDLDLFVSSHDANNGVSSQSYFKPPGPGERSTLYQNMFIEDGLSPGETPRFIDITMDPQSGGDLWDSAGVPLPQAAEAGVRIAAHGVTAGSNSDGRHNTPTDYFFGHMGSLVADLNNDLWPDIAVLASSKDSTVHILHLYINRGMTSSGWGGFELETFDITEFAPNPQSPENFIPGSVGSRLIAPMGITAGDYDNDGDLDLFSTSTRTPENDLLTNMLDGTTLAFNQQDTLFIDLPPGTALTSWGAHWLDANNDGMLDLIVATQQNIPSMLFMNKGINNTTGEHEFIEDGGFSGFSGAAKKSVGLMIADFDHDGFVDVLTRGFQGAADELWRNDSKLGAVPVNMNHWLSIKLTGDPSVAGPDGYRSTKDAMGARVTAWAILDGTTSSLVTKQIREVHSGDSNSTSSSSLELSFGFGQATDVALQVEFPSGQTFNYWIQFTAGGVEGGKHLSIDEASTSEEDINCDGVVDSADLNIILNNLDCTSMGRPFCAGDLNLDSIVDDLDVQIWLAAQ